MAAAASRPTPTELLTLPEAAVALRVGPTTVKKLIANGKLRSVHIERRRLIRRSDIDAYIESVSV